MYYQEFRPQPSLCSFIHCYWILEYASTGSHEAELIIPDGRTEIILNYGIPFNEINEQHETRQHQFFLCGQIDGALKLKPSNHVGVLGVRFKRSGLYPLIGIPINELNDQRVRLSDLLTDSQPFLELFRSCSTHRQRIDLIDRYMVKLLTGKLIDPAVEYFVDLLSVNHGHQTLEHGYDQMGFSRRHMRRKFQQWTGWSPKKMSAILRLQRLLKLAKQRHPHRLTQLALEVGYYDQSHFIRDFKSIVGELPSTYFGKQTMLTENFY